LKPKEYNLEDSNIAGLGSDLDKKVREAAARTEKAWTNAGTQIGLLIWRIEKFQVVPVPKETYGSFYSGDSYIVLNTYKKKPDSPALSCDLHFWLGKYTSQDEAGTAAYKTVELDEILSKEGHHAPQHREVQGYESDLFLKYFKNEIRILDGGVDSGFKHVEPEKYVPRLMHLKGQKKVHVQQVDASHKSLNSGDVFVLDKGLKIFQFNGKKAGAMEKQKGAALLRALVSERKGLPKTIVVDEGEKGSDAAEFWAALGGEGPIKSAEEGGSDKEAEIANAKIRKLFNLSDESGKVVFTLVAEGNAIKRNQLKSADAFVFDAGHQVYAWVGKGASANEKRLAMLYAQNYLKDYKRPIWLPISRIIEGSENESFENEFH